MTTIKENRCLGCKNLLLYPYCTAFPKGIPEEIRNGSNEHSKPTKEQGNSIVFEAIKKV